MFAITGITGQVGGHLARRLLADGQVVRAVLRDPAKAQTWRDSGCEIALADIDDPISLGTAFSGADGVFILLPPTFDPTPGFVEARRSIESIRTALLAAGPRQVVVLSTIGAQVARPNLLNQLGLLEQALRSLPMPVAFLRAAWFMENSAWDVEPARSLGVIDSALQPADKPVPMVATIDIAAVAAELLHSTLVGQTVIELEGPARVTPDEIAGAFARVLGRSVENRSLPRATWEALFRSQGMRHPLARLQMLDGFNDGWIEFEGVPRKGTTTIDQVVQALVTRPD
ncbi:NAD(P)H-binding protein [soil metagenome]